MPEHCNPTVLLSVTMKTIQQLKAIAQSPSTDIWKGFVPVKEKLRGQMSGFRRMTFGTGEAREEKVQAERTSE